MGKKLTLLASDLVTLYGALALVLFLRYGPNAFGRQWEFHVTPFTMLFMAWLFGFYITNLYEPRTLRTGRDFYTSLFQAVAIGGIISAVFFYLIPYFGIAPRINLLLFILAFTALAVGMRTLLNTLLASGTKKRLVIVGMSEESLALVRLIGENPQFGYLTCAMVQLNQHESSSLTHDFLVIHDLTNIDRYISDHRIDTVVISPAAYAMPNIISRFYGALARQVDFIQLATLIEQLTGKVPLGSIDQTWFLQNLTEGSKKSLETTKRALDIAGALVLGIPTLVMAPFIAIALALASPGPLFFRQQRTGRGGIPFEILKFRTMRTDAEATTGAVWAKENDPRVTRVGRLLRTTRIDELPQLWNILKGDMSLVGPRAERPEFDAQLTEQVPFYQQRYLIKPGLSGWAQINYPYGASIQDAIEKLRYDLYYIKHRSVVMDLEIILKTITISLRRAGR